MAENERRLSEHFRSPEGAGRLEAFCALTYEFSFDFFENELLPCVLNLEVSQAGARNPLGALERALDSTYVAVVVDSRCYRERPTLRVDLTTYSCAKVGRRQHAKMYLMQHRGLIRLFIGSANLTKTGFQANRECMAYFECSPKQAAYAPLMLAALNTWKHLPDVNLPEKTHEVLDSSMRALRTWEKKPTSTPAIRFVCTGVDNGTASLPEELIKAWPAQEPLISIHIVSPFWSAHETGALDALLGPLESQRQLAANFELSLYACAEPNGKDFLPLLPAALHEWANSKAWTCWGIPVASMLTEVELSEFKKVDLALVSRTLHAKLVLMRGNNSCLAYLGSGNCTYKGWGVSLPWNRANIEAGVMVRDTASADGLNHLLPPQGAKPLDLKYAQATVLRYTHKEDPELPWPGFLFSLELRFGADSKPGLAISWHAEEAPARWKIALQSGDGEAAPTIIWGSQERPASSSVLVALDERGYASLLLRRQALVIWPDSPEGRLFPVNLSEDAKTKLPILPGSAQLTEEDLLLYYQGKRNWDDFNEPEPPGEPGDYSQSDAELESGVDKTKIPAYQMRDFVDSLRGLEQDIRDSAETIRALTRALSGPVSPVALAQAILKQWTDGRRSDIAAQFQMIELRYAMARVMGTLELSPKSIEQFESALKQIHRLDSKIPRVAGHNFREYAERLDHEIARLTARARA